MTKTKEPRCPECDSTCLLSRYFNDYTRVQIYCGHCYAESGIRNSEVEERVCKQWGCGVSEKVKQKEVAK